MGIQVPKGKGYFWSSSPLKSIITLLWCMQQKINNDISATASADYIACDWPLSY